MEVKPGYKQSEVGVIPEDWESETLGNCLNLLTDFEANGSFADVARNVRVIDHEDFAWYVRATDLENTRPMSEVRYVDKDSYDFLKKTALHGGEVLITKRGEIGKVYLFQMRSAHATLAPNLYLLKLNNRALPQFVYFYFRHGRGNRILRTIDASTTLGALYKNDVKSLHVPVPPTKAEQGAIAEALSDADALIESLEQLLAKKRHVKQGTMQELLTGRRRLHGFTIGTVSKQTEVGMIPEEWKVKTFAELFSFSNGVNADKDSYGQGIRFINVLEPITYSHLYGPEITGQVMLPEPLATSYAVRRGDVLFNRTSETQEEVGLAATYLGTERVVFGGFVIRGRPTDQSLDPTYSGYALRASFIRSQIIAMGQGAIRANIGQQNLNLVIAPVPPLAEQQAIAETLSDIDAEIAALESRLTKARNIKQGMMQELLTGRIRLPVDAGKTAT